MLSAAAGITWWNFYFRLYPGTIRAPQVIDFLSHLLRHLPGKLLVSGTACRPIERAWSANLSAPSGAGSPSSACRVTRRNSIRWNTSGATGKIMNCPISVHTISASSVIRRAARYAACAAAPVWSARSGIKQNCHYDMQDSIDGKKTDIRADLDLSRLVDRLIIGPGSAQFNSAMKEAFINALANAGVTDTDKRVVESGIPLRN